MRTPERDVHLKQPWKGRENEYGVIFNGETLELDIRYFEHWDRGCMSRL